MRTPLHRTAASTHWPLLWAWAVLLLLLSPVPAAAQTPPEVISAEVPVVFTITDGQPVTLVYRAEGDQQITVSAKALERGALDVTLQVLAPDGRLIGFNDDRNMPYGDLAEEDAVIEELRLRDVGDYRVTVGTFDGHGTGTVLVALTAAPPVPDIREQAELFSGIDRGQVAVPQFEVYEHLVQVFQGQTVTISARSTTPGFDPILEFYDPAMNLIGENDDHAGTDPLLAERDAQISRVVIPSSGIYVARLRGFGGAGGSAELIILREAPPVSAPVEPPLRPELLVDGTVELGGVFQQTFDAEAGDLVTVVVDPVGKEFDPRVALLDPRLRPLETAERVAPTDAPVMIERVLIHRTGTYTVEVRGFREIGGDFTLAIRHTARGVSRGDPVVSRIEGVTGPEGDFAHEVELVAGSYLTASARSILPNFDPVLELYMPDGELVARNDDHGSSDFRLGLLDARIVRYPIAVDGVYRLVVSGYNLSGGLFELTTAVLLPDNP